MRYSAAVVLSFLSMLAPSNLVLLSLRAGILDKYMNKSMLQVSIRYLRCTSHGIQISMASSKMFRSAVGD